MSSSINKFPFSSSTNGRPIKVVNTVLGSADTIHTGSVVDKFVDEIWLWAQNTDATVDVKLTLLWGGTSSPDDEIEQVIPLEDGLIIVSPGLLLEGNPTPLILKAFASVANVVTLHGFVNQIKRG